MRDVLPKSEHQSANHGDRTAHETICSSLVRSPGEDRDTVHFGELDDQGCFSRDANAQMSTEGPRNDKPDSVMIRGNGEDTVCLRGLQHIIVHTTSAAFRRTHEN